MKDSIKDVDGEILLRFKKLLVEEGENEISDSQNFIYLFAETVGEGHNSNSIK